MLGNLEGLDMSRGGQDMRLCTLSGAEYHASMLASETMLYTIPYAW